MLTVFLSKYIYIYIYYKHIHILIPDKFITQIVDPLAIICHIFAAYSGSGTESDTQRRSQGTTAQTSLLTAYCIIMKYYAAKHVCNKYESNKAR